MEKIRATAVNCLDGRTQLPVIEYIKSRYKVDYVDMITAGGVNKILAEGHQDNKEFIKKSVEISVKTNGSALIAVAGHFDCRGNTAPEKIQLEHIRSAIKEIDSWGLNVTLVGLWVDSEWRVSEVKCG